LKEMVDDAHKKAEAAKPAPDAQPLVSGPQDYIPVDAVLPSGVNFEPAERGRWSSRASTSARRRTS
jgi:hypothetical protein